VGPAGEYTRTLVVDDTYGWVVEQQVANAAGQLIADARASQHRFYPGVGVSLPHHVEIRFPPARLSFAIDVAQYTVNQLVGDPAQLWSMPQMEGYSPMSLADSGTHEAEAYPYGNAQPPQPYLVSSPPEMAFRPRYRGYSAKR
jgi:hypothetical protein